VPDDLRDLFGRALDDEPVFPDGDAQRAMARGRGIRRRRGLAAGGCAAAAVLVAVLAAVDLTAEPAGPPPDVPGALALAEPECTWGEPGDPTDVWISLRDDVTAPQRAELEAALGADQRLQGLRFVSHDEAFQRFEDLWRDSPDFLAAVDESSLPDSFRLRLTGPSLFPEVAATYTGRPGVEHVYGGVCR
jgi:ferric-dicitrate binding protein FerR (iron transport regulator)